MYTYILIGTWIICIITASIAAGMAVFATAIQDFKPIRYFKKTYMFCICLFTIASITLIFGTIMFIVGGIKGWL